MFFRREHWHHNSVDHPWSSLWSDRIYFDNPPSQSGFTGKGPRGVVSRVLLGGGRDLDVPDAAAAPLAATPAAAVATAQAAAAVGDATQGLSVLAIFRIFLGLSPSSTELAFSCKQYVTQ